MAGNRIWMLFPIIVGHQLCQSTHFFAIAVSFNLSEEASPIP